MKVVQKILAALLIAAVMGCWMGVVTLADPVDETEQAPTQEYTSSLRTTIHSQEPEETTHEARRTTTSVTGYDDHDYTEYYYVDEPSEVFVETQAPQEDDAEDDDSQTKTMRATGAVTVTEPVTTEKKIINDYGEKYDWLKWLCYIVAPLSLIALIVVNVTMHKRSGVGVGNQSGRRRSSTVHRSADKRRRK